MDKDAFSFLSSKQLEKNIIDSIKFTAFLWLFADKISKDHKDELYRTIILYNASIIEAILLNYCHRHKIDFHENKYTHDHKLPSNFQIGGKEIVLSFKDKVKKMDYAITFNEMINELKDLLGVRLTNNIKELKEIRNTFHLSKTREKIHPKNAEKSNETLLKVIEKIKKLA